MGQIVIAGFSSTDKVPGAYGEVVYGAGPTSAGSIPLKSLVVGLKSTAGAAVADTQLTQFFSKTDAVSFYGAGSQGARMASAELLIPGAQVWGIAVATAGGAVAATATITIAGAFTAVWTWTYRLAGKPYTGTAAATDTVTNVAVAIKNAFNADPDCPFTATNVAGVVTFTAKCAGTSGNWFILFDTSVVGTSGATSTIAGGATVTGGGVRTSGGTGTENVANALATINPSQFDRIAVGQVDATNLALWKTQIEAQAGVLTGILQHYVVGSSDTLTNATSIAQTTLNEVRAQVVWLLNSETHPSELAAGVAGLRVQSEQSDPDASYDNVIVPGATPQSQRGDWPNHATLVSALNNGVTPLMTDANGNVRIVRSVTSHSLSGTNPDYSTLDTGSAVVPDFILTDMRLYWLTLIVPNNIRVSDNPGPNQRRPPSGIITPDQWNATVTGKLRDYEAGTNLPAPIIINVDSNLPNSNYDNVGKRIMTAMTVIPAPANHQVGISVRQSN